MLTAALALGSLPLLIAAAAIAGASQGLGFRAAVDLVVTASHPHHRGAASSAFFAVCYVGGTSLPVLGIGIAAHFAGLIHAGEVFAGVVAMIALAALFRLIGHPTSESV